MKIFNKKDLGIKRQWEYMGSGRNPEEDGIKPLVETAKKLDIMMPIIVNNTAYVICSLKSEKDYAFAWGVAEEMKIQKVFAENRQPREQIFMRNIVCPYCGYENHNSWECSDGEDKEVCGSCGSTFSYERIVTVEYTSYPYKKAKCVRLGEENE